MSDLVLSLKLALTEKQLSRLPSNAKLILLPYPFKDVRRVLAIVPEELVDQSLEWGAHISGSAEIIPEILDDTYEVDLDFDVLIAHSALSKEITGLRKKLEQMYPVKNRRTLGEDIQEMIKFHKFGQFYLYNTAEPVLETEVGNTEMSVEKLEENIRAVVDKVVNDCKTLSPKNKLFSNSHLKCAELLNQSLSLEEILSWYLKFVFFILRY